jgi:aryl-alcohol dehydrogenase-like predicted oxidoreductase
MIDLQPFGKTGHESTRTIFGGAAITGHFTEQEADDLLRLLTRYGINHIDTAPAYGDGNSEVVIGRWMEKQRDRFFLATKTLERGYRGARESIRASLEKLHTGHVDLIQLHNLTDRKEWETAMGPGGALEACVEARERGLVRFIGVTGHGFAAPEMHLRSLERFPFDSVLLPWNYVLWKNDGYRAGFSELVSTCAKRGVAVQTIKSTARRPWSGRAPSADTWYEPLSGNDDIARAVDWCLSHGSIFLNTTGDVPTLETVLEAASRKGPKPTDADMEEMVAGSGMEPIFSGGAMIFPGGELIH